MDCPNCETDMEAQGTSGNQVGPNGRRTPVSVSWEKCPECGYIIDPDGRHVPPDEQ